MPNRRQAILSSVAAGFALAVRPSLAQMQSSVIQTSSEGLSAGEKQTDSGVPLYFAKPKEGKNLAVVLVVSEIFGVHEYIRDVCRRLAKMGYLAIAPDLFKRQGDPQKIADVKEIIAQIISITPDAQVFKDLDDSAAWAKSNGGSDKLAITGFCWGGRITWLYSAHNPKVKAGVAWYGRLTGAKNEFNPQYPLDIVEKLNAPVLGLYGGLDTGIPLSDVEAMQAALQKSSNNNAKASHFEVYDNAPHAFHADYRPSYRKEDADAAWQELGKWLKEKM